MTSIEQAKTKFREEKQKVFGSIRALVGSRAALAVLTLFFVGFGAHLFFAPTRLPPMGDLSFAQVGLPPLDFGETGRMAGEARDAAIREDVPGTVMGFINENRSLVPILNAVGFAGCFVLLLLNMAAARQKWLTGESLLAALQRDVRADSARYANELRARQAEEARLRAGSRT